MNHEITRATKLASALLLAAGIAWAQETKAPAVAPVPAPAAAPVVPPVKAKAKASTKAKPAPKPKRTPRHVRPTDYSKLIELNSATKAQLMTLPGVDAGAADRIIAGRPYLLKTNIETRHILPAGSYGALRDLIYVVPPQAK